MSAGPLIKIPAATAQEVCAVYAAKKEARALLREGMTPDQFVAALLDKKQYIDAIEFMAYALPAREALWWACLCFQHAVDGNYSPNDQAAMTATVRWILQPCEENRVVAKPAADAAGPASPAGLLAVATALTGGNIAPPNAPPKAPPPFAASKPIANAVKLASTKADPVKMAPTQRAYIELALQVAEGRLI